MPDYAIAKLAEIDEIEDGRCPFRPVRHHFGITTFGATAMSARAEGDRLINEHSESEPASGEELYLVVSGHAEFELNGERHDAPAGTLVHARPGVTRTAFAREAGTTIFAVGGAPEGQPYRPSGWEVFAPLFPLFESGEYEEGADRAAELVANHPPAPGMLYNTACFESRAGRTELALTHLRQAVELQPDLAEMARADEDFAALRAEPAFTEIVGA
jgi:tetratricopeptide (TPR) repeat protein